MSEPSTTHGETSAACRRSQASFARAVDASRPGAGTAGQVRLDSVQQRRPMPGKSEKIPNGRNIEPWPLSSTHVQ